MALYRPLCEIALGDIAEFGGKAARLGEAMRLGCPVLGGVALSAELYRRFMRQGGLQGEIRSILATMQPQSIGQFQATEWAIRGAFDVRRVPDDVVDTIHSAWRDLGVEMAAVRSSATNEDSPHQSFVGQHASVLNVASPQAAVEAVLSCWASLYSAQALSYAHSFGVDLVSSTMGVMIQPMVNATARGALFTVDPVTGNADTFLLSVQAGPLPGVHTLDPYHSSPGEPPFWADLRKIGLLLDEHEQAYQSLDWVLVDEQIHLLRARPVTGAPPYIPPEALPATSLPLEWVHPPDIPPRAVRPLSWYHQSRGPSLHKAYHARKLGPASEPETPETLYACGYLYASGAIEGGGSAPIEPLRRWLQDLRLLARARKLDQSYLSLRAHERSRLHKIAQQDLSQLSRSDLAGVMAEVMALHHAFWQEHGLLKRVDAVLVRLLGRVHRRWLGADAQNLDQLLWTGEAPFTLARERFGHGTPTDHAQDSAPSQASEALVQSHRLLDITEQALAPWRDLACVEPTPELLGGDDRRPSASPDSPLTAMGRSEALHMRDAALSDILGRLGSLRGKGYLWLLGLGRRYRDLALDSLDPVLLCRVLESDILRQVGKRLQDSSPGLVESDARLFTCRELVDWLQARMSDEEAGCLATERRMTLRRWARYTPPERIEPSQAPAREPDGSADLRLAGQAICAGQVTGRARVIRGASEASQVLPSEVLVCQHLPFELTPLFSVVAAVVAEEGDLLDHASVLAREYGVPTVFGVKEATLRIQTGDMVEVDASHGVVLRRMPEPDWELWAI